VPDGFAGRLAGVMAAKGRLCVGIDPHAAILDAWSLPDSAHGARELGLRVVDAMAGLAGVVKPQVAFFERHGSAGYAALEVVLAAARMAGLLVIADVKRGDVGSTVDAYGEAWLTPGSPLEVHAMTAVAYQGLGSLDGVIDRAEAAGKGVFVLAATSNPEAARTQSAVRDDGLSVAAGVLGDVRARDSSALGVVVGATVSLLDPADLVGIPVLAPGFGAQGARLSDLDALFGPAAPTTLANVSRSVLGAGEAGIVEAIRRAREEVDG